MSSPPRRKPEERTRAWGKPSHEAADRLGRSLATAIAAACGGVSSERVPVVFTGQTDIVVWDSVERIEHFVRNARFDAKGDIGFLAPTPWHPEDLRRPHRRLREAHEALHPPTYTSAGHGGFGGSLGGSEAPPVRVVEIMDVGSYTAAILQAGDAGTLKTWLEANGFPAPDWLETWVIPYLQNRWTITVFKLKERANRATGPVRMSFRPDRPFAPYAVPPENGGPGSRLRLFLISDVPLRGVVGENVWRGSELGRAKLTPAMTATLAKDLKLSRFDIPPTPTVIAYDEVASLVTISSSSGIHAVVATSPSSFSPPSPP